MAMSIQLHLYKERLTEDGYVLALSKWIPCRWHVYTFHPHLRGSKQPSLEYWIS